MEQYIRKELNLGQEDQEPALKVKECYHDLESWLDMIEGYNIEELPGKFRDYKYRCKDCRTIFSCSEHREDHLQYFHNEKKPKNK